MVMMVGSRSSSCEPGDISFVGNGYIVTWARIQAVSPNDSVCFMKNDKVDNEAQDEMEMTRSRFSGQGTAFAEDVANSRNGAT